ncbi:MAG TPA: glycosyltransferase family 4 protein [Nitriliruptorales bacterium]|nr:glycosyltransferase family 4 protein [Nitriliruptorales bacterium]
MAQIQILQVITDTDRRGAQVFGRDLHGALTALGWRVRTVALSPGSHPDPLDVPVLGDRPLAPTTLGRLRREASDAQLIIAHGSTTLPACGLGTAGLATPFVYRNIGDPCFWANTPGRRLRVRILLQRARAVAALWPGAARALTRSFGVQAGRVRVIPNGVPVERFPPVEPGERPRARGRLGLRPDAATAVYVGALTDEKDVGTAIRAVPLLRGWQLLVVGEGPLRSSLQHLADRVAPGHVRFSGPTRTPHEAFAAADVVLLPSRTEGLPAVLIEAGMSGLPAVATDVGGVREVVLAGRTGELVPPGDPRRFARAVRTVLQHADRYGQAARRHCVARFELQVVATAWDDFLRTLLT